MSVCNPAQQALVRVFFLNSVSTPMDYRLMRVAVSDSPVEWPVPPVWPEAPKTLAEVTWEVHSQCPQPHVPKHGSAVLGLPDAAQFLRTRSLYLQQCWLKLLSNSRGAPAWALVATAAWMCAAQDGVIEWMDKVGWFDHNVTDAIDATKDKLVAVRRALRLRNHQDLSVDDVLILRKMSAICDRNKDDADWEAERNRRTVDTPVHWMPQADGSVSRSRWLVESRAWLEAFTLRVARKMSSSLRLVDIDEWWASRYVWAPSGSASSAAEARKIIEDSDMTIDKQARPNKKAVAATLPENYVWLQLMMHPAKHPRKSTKHEPGRKNRAIYAQDDGSFFISAFASVAMERSINEDGIYARQAPEDVVNWMSVHQQLVARRMFFLSLDYSDYNSEHELITLAMLDACWAKAWSTVAGNSKALKQKAYAALWVAKSQLNSWVDFGTGKTRVLGGLYSGDRNTSRDNCILHALYSHMMQKATKEMIPSFRIDGLCMTGDDEDAGFGSSVQAACYMCNHAQAGFVLKVEKQLAGTWDLPTHEYLQRALSTSARPSRPLAAALAQTISGNWHKTQYTWFDSLIDGTNDNAWELHTRGLPLDIARFLAGKVMSRCLTVPVPDGSRRDLEWWNYRTNGRYHPLWATVTEKVPALPNQKEAIKADANHQGLIAWEKVVHERFGRLIPKQRMNRYIQSCANEVFSSVFLQSRFKFIADAAAEVWPTRENRKMDVLREPVNATEKIAESTLVSLVTSLAQDTQPTSLREVLARYGVDEGLVEAMGGIKVFMRSLKPSDMQWWSEPVETKTLPIWAMHEDAAVKSYITAAIGDRATLYNKAEIMRQPGIEYSVVLASNAAGKTTAMRSHLAGDLIDMDDLLRRSGILKLVKADKFSYAQSLPSNLVVAAARRLTQVAGHIILTQYPLTWMRQILEATKSKIVSVIVVASSILTMWERTAAERAWTMAKAARRHDRFQKTAVSYEQQFRVVKATSVIAAIDIIKNDSYNKFIL